LFDELYHLSRFSHVPRQRFLTSNSDQFSFSGFNRIADCLHVLNALMIWPTQPYAIDLGRSNHLLDRFESPRIADTKLSSPRGSCFGVRRVWTVDTKHVRIANPAPRFKMKLRHESATDESDSEFVRHVVLILLILKIL
jgi:hypothetical protein